MRVTRLWPLLLLAAGCMPGMGYSTIDQVTNAAREYNEDVRWGRYDQAADHIDKERRDRFVERHTSLEEQLEIADTELVNIVVDKKKDSATCRVDYTWSLKNRGIVEKTTTKQSWQRKDGNWIMASEMRVKGAPLVLFDEPAKQDK